MTFVYDQAKYKTSFDKRVATLEKSEGVTRETLRELSREVVFILHQHGNIHYVNALLKANITGLNKKGLMQFFKAFTGFHLQEDKEQENFGLFAKKSKSAYDKKRIEFLSLYEDPLFNFWSWSERELTVEREPQVFDVSKVSKYIERSLKLASANHISQVEVLKAVLAGGVTMEALLEVLNTATAE
jgi:hypothetical protein